MEGARAVCILALLLWVLALVLLVMVQQAVSYRVCEGTLLQLPPPTVHWPPEGEHLELLDAQHGATLVAIATSILGVFLVLYAMPEKGAFSRTGWLLATVFGSLTAGAVLWLVVQYHVLHAQFDALARCL